MFKKLKWIVLLSALVITIMDPEIQTAEKANLRYN